ncbi:class I SAM-dependent methyltransferase [Streptomyces showdoensis]|uniref:SAM-dependent methyltransferase n=1 Tax=Streptomyces showdoensis TaxID=68268 RepID=A0A2P2GFP5_STREW|nr:class I SAM-dependent methyltransferase [Streptomyces showdoensis]KKZ70327.1 SAM-dependent methyltransferase [Streptomyces showdoensis]
MNRTDRTAHTTRTTRTTEDVLRLLDGLFAQDVDKWQGFYDDRSRPVPFFVPKPDENLVGYLDGGLVPTGGRALDLGCGPGRNALHLAERGFRVDAVDLSPGALAWARERAQEAGRDVRFLHGDAFAPETDAALDGPYDLIYDSGCFHHLAPHRRVTYLAFLSRHLAPGGHFALTCFAAGPGGMGSELPDPAFYRDRSLHGGLAYTAEALREVFDAFEPVDLRRMRDETPSSPLFGEPFLWTGLFRRS